MRIPFVVLGTAAIIVYSVLGAFLMNKWAVVAASGLSLDATIAELSAAGQPHDRAGGIVFASAGIILGLGWGVLVLRSRGALPTWATLSTWAGIVAMGAPAYFFGAFANLNSVGDVFYDWDREAAFAREALLYIASGCAAVLAVSTLTMAAIMAVTRASRPPASPREEASAA